LIAAELAGSNTLSVMDWRARISVDPSVRRGKPRSTGARITVYDVLEYLAGGMSEDDILADFPTRSETTFAPARCLPQAEVSDCRSGSADLVQLSRLK
jgi:uncharacterized protein (DUF433 family)